MLSNSACAGPRALFWNVKTTTTGRLSCAPAIAGNASAPAASAVTICFANDFERNMVSSRDSDPLHRQRHSFRGRGDGERASLRTSQRLAGRHALIQIIVASLRTMMEQHE